MQIKRNRGNLCLVQAVGLAIVLVALVMPAAAERPRLTVIQLTSNPNCNGGAGAVYPSTDAAVQMIAFASTCDLVAGGNPLSTPPPPHKAAPGSTAAAVGSSSCTPVFLSWSGLDKYPDARARERRR